MKSAACRYDKHDLCKKRAWNLDTEEFEVCDCGCHVVDPDQGTLL